MTYPEFTTGSGDTFERAAELALSEETEIARDVFTDTPSDNTDTNSVFDLSEHTYRERFGGIISAAVTDIKEKDGSLGRTEALGVGALAVGTQVLDRARVAVILVPHIAINVLQHTHEAPLAGAAAGGAFFAWATLVGGSLEEGLERFPRATRTFGESFPGLIDAVTDSLPGLETDKDPSGKGNRESIKSIAKTVVSHLARGVNVVGIGPTAYVAVSSAKGKDRKGVHKLNLAADLDGGMVVGLFAGGVGESIIKLAHDHPALAERIQNDAGNMKIWYSVAGLLMACQFVSSRISKRKKINSAQEDPTVTDQTGELGSDQAS